LTPDAIFLVFGAIFSRILMQVAVSIIRDIVYSAAAAGASLQTVCQAAGLSPEALQQEGTFDLAQVNAVWQAAIAETGDPLLGLHVGEQVHFEAIGIVGFTMQNSPTLYTALERAAHYQNMYSSMVTITLHQQGETATARFSPLPVFVNTYPQAARQSVESSMAFAVKAVQKLSGKRINPTVVHFAFPAPVRSYLPRYEGLFGSVLVFEETQNELLFAARDLMAPVLSYNQSLYQLLDEEAERQLHASRQGQPFSEQVRRVMVKRLQDGYMGIEQVAGELNTSIRTLQRKLNREGHTFGQVLEGLQQAYALRYLQESSLTIAEVGYLLGYGEPGVFTKAFKRWTGKNPSEFRQQKR
jgi:AraC-like DNA-binding protein